MVKTLSLPGLALFLAVLFLLGVGAALGFSIKANIDATAEIEALKNIKYDYRVARTDIAPQLRQVEYVVAFIQNNDSFLKDIFEVPCVSNFYSYLKYTNDLLDGIFLGNMLATQISQYVMLSNMTRLNNMLEAEVERRADKYQGLARHIEERNIILAHTPSIWPSTERTTSKFGFRRSPFTGVPSFHEGADLTARTGAPIKGTADGIIVFAGTRTGYGYLVTIDHGFGYVTRYGHLSKLLVKSGDTVMKGDIIALSGSTGRSAGPHLHYEVLYNGIPVNATKFLPPVIK